jgi:hypothetical protein
MNIIGDLISLQADRQAGYYGGASVPPPEIVDKAAYPGATPKAGMRSTRQLTGRNARTSAACVVDEHRR